jgi:hypothetical protein
VNKLIVTLLVIGLVLAVCCSRGIAPSPDVQTLWMNVDEPSFIYIESRDNVSAQVLISYAHVSGWQSASIPIENLDRVLKDGWQSWPLEGPPPQSDNPLDEYVNGSVIIDGSAALVGQFRGSKHVLYTENKRKDSER